jgi:hypothetical protein
MHGARRFRVTPAQPVALRRLNDLEPEWASNFDQATARLIAFPDVWAALRPF